MLAAAIGKTAPTPARCGPGGDSQNVCSLGAAVPASLSIWSNDDVVRFVHGFGGAQYKQICQEISLVLRLHRRTRAEVLLEPRSEGRYFRGLAQLVRTVHCACINNSALLIDDDIDVNDALNADVARSGQIRSRPQDVMAPGSKLLYDWLREVLICEEAHLGRDRERLVFVGQVARVRQARENVFARQTGVVGQDLAFRLASCQKLQDEFDGDTRSPDDWLASQDRGVDDDAL